MAPGQIVPIIAAAKTNATAAKRAVRVDALASRDRADCPLDEGTGALGRVHPFGMLLIFHPGVGIASGKSDPHWSKSAPERPFRPLQLKNAIT
jgi:hypothetical protein